LRIRDERAGRWQAIALPWLRGNTEARPSRGGLVGSISYLLEIEALLADDRLSDEGRAALHGAQRALRNVLDPGTCHPASQTFYRTTIEAASRRRH
jgi:hypothetical protein